MGYSSRPSQSPQLNGATEQVTEDEPETDRPTNKQQLRVVADEAKASTAMFMGSRLQALTEYKRFPSKY